VVTHAKVGCARNYFVGVYENGDYVCGKYFVKSEDKIKFHPFMSSGEMSQEKIEIDRTDFKSCHFLNEKNFKLKMQKLDSV